MSRQTQKIRLRWKITRKLAKRMTARAMRSVRLPPEPLDVLPVSLVELEITEVAVAVAAGTVAVAVAAA
jgi:hypothetical protein